MWTSVTKPTGADYVNVNAQGKEQYDQASLTYDDASTFYDGTDPNSYTMVAKPVSSVYTFISKPVS